MSDRDGMYVVVQPSGAIVFRYDYRLNGRRETLTLGRYGPDGLSLARAREKLIDAKRAISEGRSPAQEKQHDKRRLKEAKRFGEFGEKWFQESRMADSTRAMRRSIYERDILPTALRSMAMSRHDSRRVNNRFGEGTSPRLRQIREGLDALGLKSDAILHHATPRIFYGCELSPGSRSALLNLTPATDTYATCPDIGAAWRRRWVMNRARREETLQALERLGPTSVRASLHADADGQFLLPIDGG